MQQPRSLRDSPRAEGAGSSRYVHEAPRSGADGWRDLRYAPGVSLVHGILVAVGGWNHRRDSFAPLDPLCFPAALSRFVLVAPILRDGSTR